MKLSGESQSLEATRPTTILSTRATTNIATWNVRTMYEAGKLAQIAAEFTNYKLEVLGISESRWTGSGQKRLASGELILFSGHEEDNAPHSQGVALMLSKRAQRSLIGWQALGPRMLISKFRTKKRRININIIQCYAPTNDSDKENKEEFYNRLQAVLENCSRRDITCLMGDFNAKIGSDNRGYEQVMGRQGLGDINDNGERFTDLCASYNLVIGGSIFPHKRIHKATWRSPDSVTENQIDHICVSQRFRHTLQDVRVKRGADVASDHHLLAAQLKLKLRKNCVERNTRQRFNTELLKETTKREEFKITLTNKYQVLGELLEEDTIDAKWKTIKEAVTSSCQEVLGPRKYNHKEWISAETMKKVQERKDKKAAVNSSRTRAEKAKMQAEYTVVNRSVKKCIKADKRKYVETLATEAERAAHLGNVKDLYNIIKKLSGKYGKPERPVKDRDGKPIMGEDMQKRRWKEYFEELLNRPTAQDPPDITPADSDLPIDISAPTEHEIRRALKQLKNNKAAGPDNIPGEVLKANIETTTRILFPLFEEIWRVEQVPSEWKEGYLIKIPKKGDLSSCSNYRGITLLSLPSKVFNRVILNRIKDIVDPQLRDQQAGFRSNRSCTDQIATLRIILEQSLEWNSPLYVNFVDYEKAFDSVDRATLWKLLRHYGVPDKIVSIIRKSYEGMTCRVVHSGQLTDPFQVRTGVRQGCLLSPFLFLLAVDWIMKVSTAQSRNGLQWTTPWTQLEDLDFADDLALLSHTQKQMQEKTNSVAANSTRLGLNINREKSKILKINSTNPEPITVDDAALEEVESFVYLGSIIDAKGGTEADVRARIGKARTAFHLLKNVWSSKSLSLPTKYRIFNTSVKSILLYGAETWRTTASTTRKIQTFINNCLRRILGIHWPDTISNEELWQRTGQQPIDQEILQRRWRWIGHTLRRPTTNTTRQALTWNPQGKRRIGRPRNTWRRDLDNDCERMGLSWGQLERLAQERDDWRELVGGLYPSQGATG